MSLFKIVKSQNPIEETTEDLKKRIEGMEFFIKKHSQEASIHQLNYYASEIERMENELERREIRFCKLCGGDGWQGELMCSCQSNI